jgi:hypothetical protein
MNPPVEPRFGGHNLRVFQIGLTHYRTIEVRTGQTARNQCSPGTDNWDALTRRSPRKIVQENERTMKTKTKKRPSGVFSAGGSAFTNKTNGKMIRGDET